jgi:putative copper resistance protein D
VPQPGPWPVGIWDATVVAAKAVTYAATLSASGGILFLAYSDALIQESAARIRRLIRRLLIVSALASGAKILGTAGSMSGDASGLFDPDLVGMVVQAGEGKASLIRLVGLMLMIPALGAHRRPPPAALIGSLMAATSFAWVGHVHALAIAWLPTTVIAVHLLGAAFWLGALGPLLIVASDADLPRVAATAARFGAAALFVVGALLTAGVCLLFLLLRDVGELWSGSYGRFVSFKIVLVVCLLGLAAINHLRLTPRLIAHDARAVRALQTSIRLEISLACVILVVTAAMTTLTGPAAVG